jgi:hypothetical protein
VSSGQRPSGREGPWTKPIQAWLGTTERYGAQLNRDVQVSAIAIGAQSTKRRRSVVATPRSDALWLTVSSECDLRPERSTSDGR